MQTTTLGQLVTALRAETGHAISAAQGLNILETLKHIIRRTEVELWSAFDWDELTVRADIPTLANQFLYDFPSELTFDQTRHLYWTSGDKFSDPPLAKGICEDHILAGGGNSSKGAPTEWDVKQDQIRIWPTPSVPGTLRLVGQRPLNALVSESDVCTLDSLLITLFAAAEMLERAGAKDAAGKAQKAQRHLAKVRGNQHKIKTTTMGAIRPRHPGIGGAHIRIR